MELFLKFKKSIGNKGFREVGKRKKRKKWLIKLGKKKKKGGFSVV
jgi:hypothetical protein